MNFKLQRLLITLVKHLTVQINVVFRYKLLLHISIKDMQFYLGFLEFISKYILKAREFYTNFRRKLPEMMNLSTKPRKELENFLHRRK